jgi:predicted adenine nucleotide alpha hydrolase (AANH) superfamily ATPase
MKDAVEILDRMNLNQKVNYDKVFQKVRESWKTESIRPTILLHSCCAPCSTYSLEYLCESADVTIYFANSNIHPQSEYERRKIVQKEFVEEFNRRTGKNVRFIAADYEPNLFIEIIKKKHLENEPEGGSRCSACFQMRLDLAAEKAKELGFDYFGSALTISPKKNGQLINEIGLDIQKIYGVNFLPTDFKKNGGYQRSVEMCKEYDIFRQCYCGCVFGARQQGIDLKTVNQEANDFLKTSNKRTDVE